MLFTCGNTGPGCVEYERFSAKPFEARTKKGNLSITERGHNLKTIMSMRNAMQHETKHARVLKNRLFQVIHVYFSCSQKVLKGIFHVIYFVIQQSSILQSLDYEINKKNKIKKWPN